MTSFWRYNDVIISPCVQWEGSVRGEAFPCHDVIVTMIWKCFFYWWRVDFHHKQPVMWNCDVFFAVCFNNLLNKQSSWRRWRLCDTTVWNSRQKMSYNEKNLQQHFVIAFCREFKSRENSIVITVGFKAEPVAILHLRWLRKVIF